MGESYFVGKCGVLEVSGIFVGKSASFEALLRCDGISSNAY